MCSTKISRGRIASRAIEPLDAFGSPADPITVQGLRHRLETLIAPMIERAGAELSSRRRWATRT